MKQVRHSEEERRQIVSEWRQGGQGIMAFCEARGIPYRSFKRWQAEQGDGAGKAEAFLPVLFSHQAPDGEGFCRIRVGDLVVIECTGESNLVAVERAIRAAVAACGLM